MQLSNQQAKHTALKSLGFGSSSLSSPAQVLDQLGFFQLDSVNVFERAHLMPAFSRIGAYSREDFEAWAFGKNSDRGTEEYWAHCAALIPRADYALFEFRRQQWRRRESIVKMLIEQRALVSWVLKEIETNGPMKLSEFEHEKNKRQGDWWGWSEIKIILERLWFIGELVADGREGFARRYSLPQQAGTKTDTNLTEPEQKLLLIERAAKRLGVGTLEDIADYYRFYPTEARPLISELVSAGILVEVSVTGWEKKAFVHKDTQIADSFEFHERPIRLLSPFDPLMFFRNRVRRIFDFDYQIEIYVPEAKRKFGYYTLPILFQDQLIGRVDLKHHRKDGVLEVKSLWKEGDLGNTAAEAAHYLAEELRLAARWIGAATVTAPQSGNWQR